MSVTDQRRVRKLHLRAPDEALGRRGVHLLEDALRTASLPTPVYGKLLVVRRLALGRIDPTQSAATLALTIEQRMQRLGADAVYALDVDVATQPAVYFHDEVEPYVALALKIARGESTSAWFWPLVVPGWRAQMAPASALRWLLVTVARTDAGRAGLLRLVEHLHQHGQLDPLLAALSASDGAPLLALSGWPATGFRIVIGGERRWPSPPSWSATLLRWRERWGRQDHRTYWLAAVALATVNPLRLLEQPTLLQQAAQLLQWLEASESPLADVSRRPTSVSRAQPMGSKPAVAQPERPTSGPTHGLSAAPAQVTHAGQPHQEHDSPLGSADQRATLPTTGDGQVTAAYLSERVARQPADHGSETDDAASRPIRPQQGSAPPQPPLVAGQALAQPSLQPPALESPSGGRLIGLQPTAYAGLFFLTPILTHLGMATWLAQEPRGVEMALPYRLLGYLCQQLGAPSEDPMFVLVEQIAQSYAISAPVEEPFNFVPPAAWRLLVQDNEEAANWLAPAQVSVGTLCARWQAVLTGWCERYTDLTLVEVVCRPGRLTATATHIDLFFALAQADLRIRKAGLDLDPGWVSWLGRVVQFHYVES